MPFRPYPRSKRVAEVIKRRMAEIIIRRIKDPRVRLISVTRVEVSGDLKQANIYLSVYGDEKETLGWLENARGFIRQEIGRGIRLRYLPDISFRIDGSIKESFRIKEILDSLTKREVKDEEGF